MAEFDSRQITALAATPPVKAAPYDGGKVHVLIGTTPATAAWAQNDTFEIGTIPKGSRILRSSRMWHGAFGASVTMTVGLRSAATGTEIDLDGILASTSVATANLVNSLSTGALMTIANGYITTEDAVVVATLGGANPTDDIQAEFEIYYVPASA